MNIVKKLTKLSLVAFAASLSFVAGANAWGPERQTFTMESPASYPIFNSVTNNPTIGDERDFVRVGQINADVTTMSNEVEIIPGKQYLVYIYFHNDASSTYNSSAYNNVGVAFKTKMSASFPTVVTPAEKGKVSAIITSENSKPLSVWDEAYFTTKTEKVLLSYVAGSAKIYNDWAANGSIMPSDLFTEGGTPIGLNALNGVIPGCEEYHGVVSYVVEAKELSGSIEKSVDKAAINPGDEVEFTLTIKNTGDVALTNATIKDSLPEGLTLIPGSTYLTANNSGVEDLLSDNITTTGYNLGRIGTGNTIYIKYRAKAGDDFDCAGKKLKNVAALIYDSETASGDSKTASAEVVVKKTEGCEGIPVDPEPVEPDPEPSPELKPDPESTPEESTPEESTPEESLPDKIVDTGPIEIVLAIIIVLAILGAGFYFWRTRRTLKEVENKVSGKESDDEKNNEETKNLNQKPDEYKNEDDSSQK